MKKIDMSSDAVLRRLKQTEDLRRVSLALMRAKVLSRDEADALRKAFRDRKRAERSSG